LTERNIKIQQVKKMNFKHLCIKQLIITKSLNANTIPPHLLLPPALQKTPYFKPLSSLKPLSLSQLKLPSTTPLLEPSELLQLPLKFPEKFNQLIASKLEKAKSTFLEYNKENLVVINFVGLIVHEY
jgi:ABC-type oligopeptide transport system substrate-binding subunit